MKSSVTLFALLFFAATRVPPFTPFRRACASTSAGVSSRPQAPVPDG